MNTEEIKQKVIGYLEKNFGENRFTEEEIENCIILSINRGAVGEKQIIKETINFLYCFI